MVRGKKRKGYTFETVGTTLGKALSIISKMFPAEYIRNCSRLFVTTKSLRMVEMFDLPQSVDWQMAEALKSLSILVRLAIVNNVSRKRVMS